jgi:hypothetical protein
VKHQEKTIKTTVLDYNNLESRDTIAISGHPCETSVKKRIKTTVLTYNKLELKSSYSYSIC